MKMFKAMLFVIGMIFSALVHAYSPKEGNVNAMVGPYVFKTDFKNVSSPANCPWVGGAGIIVNGDISHNGALEIGLFHLNKRFLRSRNNLFVEEMTQVLHITMGYKQWITQDISFSTALYSEYPLGNIRRIHNDFDPSGDQLQTSAHDKNEYGFDLAVQGEVWQGPIFDIITELRYAISVTPHDHEESNHYGVFVGLRYFVQEKDPDKKPNKKDFD